MEQTNDSRLQHAFNEKGEALSPLLPEHVKNFLIDIDGTVCDDIPNEEPERMISVMPYPDALKIINKWFEEGHSIYFFTSRTEEHRTFTETWLKKHGFKYSKSKGYSGDVSFDNYLRVFYFETIIV